MPKKINTSKTWKFQIKEYGDPRLDIASYRDTIIVNIVSGKTVGEKKDFIMYMCDCIAKWYTGTDVSTKVLGGTYGCMRPRNKRRIGRS